VLQCVAVCGSALQSTAVRRSVLQCVAVCCSAYQAPSTVNHGTHGCSALQCVAVCCSVLQCVAVCCSVLQCMSSAVVGTPWPPLRVCYDSLVSL